MSRPLNRAARRAREREARRDFRNAGCRCRAAFTSLDPVVFGATYAATVDHQPGCPFGDRIEAVNDRGLLTALVRWGPSRRCGR